MLWNEYNSYTSSGNKNQGIILYGKKHEKSMQLIYLFIYFTEWKKHNLKFISWSLRIDKPRWATKGFLNKQSARTMLDKILPENHFAGTLHHVKRQNSFRKGRNSEGCSFLCWSYKICFSTETTEVQHIHGNQQKADEETQGEWKPWLQQSKNLTWGNIRDQPCNSSDGSDLKAEPMFQFCCMSKTQFWTG